jgi:hypothetical protein
MDIGTKEEPGRELAASDVSAVSGGHVAPDGEGGSDSTGGVSPTIDYAAVAGGDCVALSPEPPPQENPIWKALHDAWNGINA